ncbi:proline dipeptidase [Agrobacterium salinitolerans]|uniref:M24 family metallopeptidase n=1 Tax=Agrobacterium salinitolerans TaxID=1183413 RepID=UPI00099007CF|nr:Xaa-Pro peptidase family protein [Agrobacterium salinitolerans]OOO19525.1 proline dipeptidase [Agrobacterium salinitolerans]PNQ21998.1 aminopeptidase P family protein [Rhizobium sp. YIC5082]
MSDIDRSRAQQLMREADIDALVLFQPEAFRYAVGAPAGVATMWGRAGSAIALVPADAGVTLAAVVSDHAAPLVRKAAPEIDLRCHRIWIDMVDLSEVKTIAQVDDAYRRNNSGGPRPETFDRAACFGLLADLLRERGLSGARIGADLEFMPAADFLALRQALPHVNWIDGSTVLKRLRAVKSEREIKLLRQAAAAAEAGLVAMAAAVRPGAALGQLSAAWKSGVQAHAATSGFSLSGHWDYISVGPALSDMAAVVTPGALIKADVGTLVEGYSSDGARSFSWGPVSPLTADVFSALEAAFARGLEALRPGNTFGAVHAAMLASMRSDGFSEYYRGHFGHSVGGGVGIEEWPFFSHDNPEIILPGMVVAVEAPFYGEGLGALMIEDQFLVTASGAECMNSLPRTLRDLSAN